MRGKEGGWCGQVKLNANKLSKKKAAEKVT